MFELALFLSLFAPAAQTTPQYIRCQTDIATAQRRATYMADYLRKPRETGVLHVAVGYEAVVATSAEFADGVRPRDGALRAWRRIVRDKDGIESNQAGIGEALEGETILKSDRVEVALISSSGSLKTAGPLLLPGMLPLEPYANWDWSLASVPFAHPFAVHIEADGKRLATAQFDPAPLAAIEQILASRLARWDAARSGDTLPTGCEILE